MPLEIELAERLIAPFPERFRFSPRPPWPIASIGQTWPWPGHRCACWRGCRQRHADQRFIKPAWRRVATCRPCLDGLERGGDVPADIGWAGSIPPLGRVLGIWPVTWRPAAAKASMSGNASRVTRCRSCRGWSICFVVFPVNSGRPAGLPIGTGWSKTSAAAVLPGASARQRAGRMVESRHLIAMQPGGATTGWLASSGAITGDVDTQATGRYRGRWPAGPTHEVRRAARLPLWRAAATFPVPLLRDDTCAGRTARHEALRLVSQRESLEYAGRRTLPAGAPGPGRTNHRLRTRRLYRQTVLP